MSEYIFDPVAFRLKFPAFANETVYPTATLEMNWDSSGCYVDNDDSLCQGLTGDCRYAALNLMTAHLTALSTMVASGQIPGLVQSATIDKVSVSLTPPPVKNQWQWWLSLTPYGQQLLAMLQANSVGGFYFGGLPETLAFRKFGGIF